jgi:hypothetical protein
VLEIDKSKAACWQEDWITFVSERFYEIRIPFESQNASLISYSIIHSNTAVATGDFVKRYKVGVLLLFELKWQIK